MKKAIPPELLARARKDVLENALSESPLLTMGELGDAVIELCVYAWASGYLTRQKDERSDPFAVS